MNLIRNVLMPFLVVVLFSSSATVSAQAVDEAIGDSSENKNAYETPKTAPWIPGTPSKNAHTEYSWELYNVAEDFSQAKNLAAEYPEKLQALKDQFLVEATKYNVLPLDDSNIERFAVSNRPSYAAGRDTFTFREGMIRIPEGSAPDIKNRSWEIEATVTIPEKGGSGLIVTHGGRFNGIGLYVLNGKPCFTYNYLNLERTNLRGKEVLAPGEHTLLVKSVYAGGGPGKSADIKLFVDGKSVAEGRAENTIPNRVSLDETFDVGEDTGTPIVEDYTVPFKFTGKIKKVEVQLK